MKDEQLDKQVNCPIEGTPVVESGLEMSSVKARITRDIITWARESSGLTLAEASEKLGIAEERLAGWEGEGDLPTIPQLRNMAALFKRPLAIFFLAERPKGFDPMRDFRKHPGLVAQHSSPALLYEVRRAQERRQLALDLYEDSDEPLKLFSLAATPNDDPEWLGSKVRDALGVTYQQQLSWRDIREGYRGWRVALEAMGVLVFQATSVDSYEMRAFSITESALPVVVVNRNDAPAGRIFSLLHEFTHLMLRSGGLCDLEENDDRPPEERKIEIFCNRVAGASLMPRDRILSEALVNLHGKSAVTWKDADIKKLANRYSVSREALVRRLLILGRTTEGFYEAKRNQYKAEAMAKEEVDKRRKILKPRKFGKNPPVEAISNLGPSFVGLVMQNYFQSRLTLSDVSEYLGVRTKHVPTIQEKLGF